MPREPKGEKRPTDVIGAAVMVGRIATGEIEDGPKNESEKDPAPVNAKQVRAFAVLTKRWSHENGETQ